MVRSSTLNRSTMAADEQQPQSLRVVSICKLFPTEAEPHRGIFVARRIDHLSRQANVRVLQPVPWFPFLRGNPKCGWTDRQSGPRNYRQKMFYLPGVLKSRDGRWLARSILPVLEQWHEDSPIDVIDAHFGYPEGVGAVLAARRLKLPVFLTLRGNEQVYLKVPAIRKQLLEACGLCTGIITVSHSLRDTIVSAGVDGDKIQVIPNAVDRAEFFPSSRDEARSLLGLPCESPIVVSVGQLVHEKGHDVLIRAMAELRHHQPDVLLVIVGGASYEPHYPRKLQKLVDELGLNHAVRFVGVQRPESVSKWLSAANLFALCTHREGCCNSILEAIASGIPVVTTPVGDNAHYVESSRNGFLVSRNEPQTLSNVLNRALSQTWDPRVVSNSMPPSGWDDVARSVIDFFHSQLNQTGKSPSNV